MSQSVGRQNRCQSLSTRPVPRCMRHKHQPRLPNGAAQLVCDLPPLPSPPSAPCSLGGCPEACYLAGRLLFWFLKVKDGRAVSTE